MAKSKMILKVTVLYSNSKPQDKFVQQVTEKIVVVCNSNTQTTYMRRDTGFPYSAKDKAEEVGIVSRASLNKVEEFMKVANKPKWHSGWKPAADSTFDGYEVIDCTSTEDENVEAERKAQGLRKITKEEADKLRAQSVASIGSQVFDDGDFQDDEPETVKTEVPKMTGSPELPFETSNDDEFDDRPSDFDDSPDASDDMFNNPPELLGGNIDEMF